MEVVVAKRVSGESSSSSSSSEEEEVVESKEEERLGSSGLQEQQEPQKEKSSKRARTRDRVRELEEITRRLEGEVARLKSTVHLLSRNLSVLQRQQEEEDSEEEEDSTSDESESEEEEHPTPTRTAASMAKRARHQEKAKDDEDEEMGMAIGSGKRTGPPGACMLTAEGRWNPEEHGFHVRQIEENPNEEEESSDEEEDEDGGGTAAATGYLDRHAEHLFNVSRQQYEAMLRERPNDQRLMLRLARLYESRAEELSEKPSAGEELVKPLRRLAEELRLRAQEVQRREQQQEEASIPSSASTETENSMQR